MSQQWASMGIYLALSGCIGVVCWQVSGRIQGRRLAIVIQEHQQAPARPIFRRPFEWGPLEVSREDVERIRLEILIDQMAAVVPVSAEAMERAAGPESTRAIERADDCERAHSREHVVHWLMHWQDDGLFALTGRSLA